MPVRRNCDMRECESCKNLIPDKMRICPHCGKLPPTLWPQFYLYVVLTLIAFGCAVYFRPFLNGPMIGEAAMGVLWVAEIIFLIFGIIFINVSIIVAKDYAKRSFEEMLTKQERIRFMNMKQHIAAGRHFYDEGGAYCTVCGHKRTVIKRK